MQSPPHHRSRTLFLAAALHAFTHVYQVALLPLYFLIQKDLGLVSVGKATLLVTALMIAYFVPSYPMGVLADRISRKKLLAIGLGINGLGFIGLSFARTYELALLCVIIAGFGGSFYHPAATAMVARLYPTGTGRALGLVGMGASVGFFLGPIYSGWRAETAGWRAPVLELGILGVVDSILFTWLAAEETAREVRPVENRHLETMFPTLALWMFFIASAFAFSMRDFAGSSMGSLGSLFLQKAHGMDLKATGVALSVIFIGSLISNPLFGGLSDGARLRTSSIVLVLAAVAVATFPFVPRSAVVPALLVYGFFFMANYPIVEAALMESVPDAVRGRVFGIFITIGGLVGNLSHWLVGKWVQRLGSAADSVAAYYPAYALLATLIVVALVGLPCLAAIRRREGLSGSTAGAPLPQPESLPQAP
ncbi:MAG: MFS transporter [Verrucomicrobia subdivision 3 bacterium]|nr:MFS transporter [Limisphaerales bacterium]